jgi:mono/diheme cytochrome c family protein
VLAAGTIAASAGLLLFACSNENPPTELSGRADDDAQVDAGDFARDGSSYDSAPPVDSGLGVLRFMPNVVYSGFDGAHSFKVPLAVYDGESDLTVTASDPTAVTIAPTKLKNPVNEDGVTDLGAYFLVTVLKAGPITLTASSAGRSATATLNVTSYEEGRWAIGEARYTNAGAGTSQPCTNCHVDGKAIDHSPAALATATDSDVGVIITTGVKPGPSVITGVDGGHKWTVTDEQRDGLVTYLRGLEPRGFE